MHVILEQALCLYCHILLFVFQNVTKWNLQTWSKFAFATFGSERVKLYKEWSMWEISPFHICATVFQTEWL